MSLRLGSLKKSLEIDPSNYSITLITYVKWIILVIIFLCVIIIPFGKPVVPDEKIIKITWRSISKSPTG